MIHECASIDAMICCKDILTTYFKGSESGPMDSPFRGTPRSASGNLIFSFKTRAEVLRAKAHADGWVKLIDLATSHPQHAYTVVAHNPPADSRPGDSDMTDAIQTLEVCNLDPLTHKVNLPHISNLAWLNSTKV